MCIGCEWDAHLALMKSSSVYSRDVWIIVSPPICVRGGRSNRHKTTAACTFIVAVADLYSIRRPQVRRPVRSYADRVELLSVRDRSRSLLRGGILG